MTHGGCAAAQSVGNGLVIASLAHQGDDLALSCGEGLHFEHLVVEGWGGLKTASHFAQHMGDEQILQPDFASGDLGDRFEED
jgi:hypothetical protein